MFNMIHLQQMMNLFDSRIDNKAPAHERNKRLSRKFARENITKVNAKERFGQKRK